MENAQAQTSSVSVSPEPSFGRFATTLRIRLKDRFIHPFSAGYWPGCLAVDRMSREQLLELQAMCLQQLIDHAVQHVPYYKDWARISGYRPGDRPNLADLPIVTKADYRADIERFQSDAYLPKEMMTTRTSGSSGEPFRIRAHRESTDYSYCCLWRSLRRHGLRPGMRRAYLWGAGWSFGIDTRQIRIKRAKLAVRDWLNTTLFVDAYDLSDKNVAAAVDRIQAYRPEYLHGYVSAIYTIARHMNETGRRFEGFKLRAAVTESEKLYDFQKQAIAQAFGCPVLEHYGSVEFGNIAQTDPRGILRINEDIYRVEQQPTGEAVITNIRAKAYTFIRYKLGDIIDITPTPPEGLPFAAFRSIVGRTVDLIPIAGGGFVHGVALAHVIDAHLARVKKYQIHQTAIGQFTVRLIVSEPLGSEAEERIVRDLRRLVGESVQARIEYVDHIAPAASGKFRWVISDVPATPPAP